jgi:hypothetical protein
VDVLDGGLGDNVIINSAVLAQATQLNQFIASSFVSTDDRQSDAAVADLLVTQQQSASLADPDDHSMRSAVTWDVGRCRC